jgi:hypothetical protein
MRLLPKPFEDSKRFFFEKKKQKTSLTLGRGRFHQHGSM